MIKNFDLIGLKNYLVSDDVEKSAADTRSDAEARNVSANNTNSPDSQKNANLSTITVSQEDKDKVTLRMAAYEIQLIGQGSPYGFKTEYEKGKITQPLVGYINRMTPEAGKTKSNEDLAKMILLRDTDLGSAQISAFKNEDNYAGILRAMSDAKIGFDLEGTDSNYPIGFKKNLLGALARAFGMNPDMYSGIPLNESKVTYGKSHATLMRERYWGRY